MTCTECNAVAFWVRCTQFAGDHPYCKDCAAKEVDFGPDGWTQADVYIRVEKARKMKQSLRDKQWLKSMQPLIDKMAAEMRQKAEKD